MAHILQQKKNLMAVARAISPFMPQIGLDYCQRKETKCLCQYRVKRPYISVSKLFYGKAQSMFLKEMNTIPVNKDKQSLTWPRML